jgi:hypothetical protein
MQRQTSSFSAPGNCDIGTNTKAPARGNLIRAAW